jgi:hypothetical protein
MFVAACVLPFVGLILLSLTPSTDRREAVIHTLGGAALVMTLVLALMLTLLRQPTCQVLGGHWNGRSCLNEWGGNGDNGS